MSTPKFNHSHKGFSGKVDDLVYGMYKRNKVCIARDFVVPKSSANSLLMGTINRNLGKVYKSALATYKADLKVYSQKLAEKNSAVKKLDPSAKAIFIKMMWAWHKVDPVQNDLALVTAEDIIDKNIPCKTVKDAVEAEYLPEVVGYETLTQLIG